MIVLGFDPGGISQFGWCVTEPGAGSRLRILESGNASCAADAHEHALQHVGDHGAVSAAGIDSPLFWIATGDREVDRIVRAAMTDLGAPNVHGTVQQVNSLRGACLAQGVMLAHLLRRDLPNVRVTESHPKALLWLLKVANRQRAVRDVTAGDLADFVESNDRGLSDHERDAVLGAVAAFAMIRQVSGWLNLAEVEQDPFTPAGAVEYWMPIPEHTA